MVSYMGTCRYVYFMSTVVSLVKRGDDRPGGFHSESLNANEPIQCFEIQDGEDALFEFGN